MFAALEISFESIPNPKANSELAPKIASPVEEIYKTPAARGAATQGLTINVERKPIINVVKIYFR